MDMLYLCSTVLPQKIAGIGTVSEIRPEGVTMRTVYIFKNGNNRAIRLPRDMDFEGVSELEIIRVQIQGPAALTGGREYDRYFCGVILLS